jgi:hypothetical protein
MMEDAGAANAIRVTLSRRIPMHIATVYRDGRLPQGYQTGPTPTTLQPGASSSWENADPTRAGTARHCSAFGNACTCQCPSRTIQYRNRRILGRTPSALPCRSGISLIHTVSLIEALSAVKAKDLIKPKCKRRQEFSEKIFLDQHKSNLSQKFDKSCFAGFND